MMNSADKCQGASSLLKRRAIMQKSLIGTVLHTVIYFTVCGQLQYKNTAQNWSRKAKISDM